LESYKNHNQLVLECDISKHKQRCAYV
jgi:hypothetical protein